jgi:uncharacterized protein (TIGR02246 family)
MNDADTTAGLEQLHAEILAAWNRGDAEAYASRFSSDAIVIGFDGSEMSGRDEIAKQLRSIFADHEVAAYVRIVRRVQKIGADTALLHAVVGMVPPDGGDLMTDRNAVQLLTAVRDGDTWRATSFQNTPAALDGRPDAAKALTEALRAAARQ